MVRPSHPQTTLGMPTNTSIAGLGDERAQRGATSAMNSDRPTDSGVEMGHGEQHGRSCPR